MKLKSLIISIAIPLAIGGISSLITMDAMKGFEALSKPPLSPPGWLFAPVWGVLYVLMGIASYLVVNSGADNAKIKKAISAYALSLLFNFLWPIAFFNFSAYLFAFIWLVVLIGIVIYTTVLYYGISKTAAYLMMPYIIWMMYAAYLNFGIFMLN